jgi:hypothetical protein
MRRYPGEVWILPPEAEQGGDFKARRHVLLTPCEDARDIGILAYASTQPTEARFGAPYLWVDPAATGYPNTGFSKPTYVYPSRLTPSASEDFLRMTGRLVDEMPHLRRLLRTALGFGTGTANNPGAAAGSWRGRVVELSATRREAIGYERAVVLTDPAYSRRRRYQIIVPIEDPREFEAGTGDVEISAGAWFQRMDPDLPGAILAVADVQSVFHVHDITRWRGVVVDEPSMNLLETALTLLFSL